MFRIRLEIDKDKYEEDCQRKKTYLYLKSVETYLIIIFMRMMLGDLELLFRDYFNVYSMYDKTKVNPSQNEN